MPSPISLMASSQDMRFHCPPASFIGYLTRRSAWPCSRTDAPFAQCAPRLNGESKSGSWPVQTPFCTSATMPQPTEQCVQTLFLIVTSPVAAEPAAWAFLILPGARTDAAAPAPTARPERLRNARRSMLSPMPGLSWVCSAGLLRMSFISSFSLKAARL